MRQCVVINGAENFVGRRLLSRLAHSDWVQPLPVATGDRSTLRRAVRDGAAVAHCIVGGARTILGQATVLYELLRQQSLTVRVVHLSSMTVYGSATGIVNEQSELRADLGPYSRAQAAAEQRAMQHGNVVILRPGAEHGPGCPHWTEHIARLLRAGRLGDLGAAGDGLSNLTYIEDLVTAIARALREPDIERECFNIALDVKPSWNEYFAAVAHCLGAVPIRRLGPLRLQLERRLMAPPLKAVEILAHALHLQLPTPPPITGSLLRTCRQEIALDVGKAQQRLAMQWTPLSTALAQTAAYYAPSA